MALMVVLAALFPVVLGIGCKYDGNMLADCSDLYKAGQNLSGVYSIYPAGNALVWVYCHMVSGGKAEDKGGWTVIQRRMDGSVNFYRGWDQYKRGFGDMEGEYWLGLENMYQLIRNRKYMLRVDLEDFEGRTGFALYSSFSVGPETDGYRLQVSEFTDGGSGGDAMNFQNGMKFSTFDKDQDIDENRNCAKAFIGAFWYSYCHATNPNGVYLWGGENTHYGIGVIWLNWKKSHHFSMKSISMKIRRVY